MTPASWELRQSTNGYWFIDHEQGGESYTLTKLECGERDARLIAAAPDLLKALKALVSTARTFRNVPKDEQEWTSIDDDALEAAFDAIAKATGEQA